LLFVLQAYDEISGILSRICLHADKAPSQTRSRHASAHAHGQETAACRLRRRVKHQQRRVAQTWCKPDGTYHCRIGVDCEMGPRVPLAGLRRGLAARGREEPNTQERPPNGGRAISSVRCSHMELSR
jgi:hypothetical protein